MKDLYTDNYKTLMKITEDDTSEKIHCAYGLEELILLKWWYYPRQLQSQCNPYQNTSGVFHRTRTNNSKICMET